MLSQKTMDTVKATAPVLEEHGEALTRHFYQRMFKHNPEVLPLFNPANQHTGVQQQALAMAVWAYAANIDNLGALSDAVELIAQKHASLRIQPEHYPIVGANLLASIKEVLGDAATDDIIDAWSEAYSFLADILIKREEEIYSEQEQSTGGWRDFKKYTVAKKVKESDIVTSLYLQAEDGSKPPSFKPGQYITVRVDSAHGYTTMRNYSLSDKPGQDYLRISVKREDHAGGCPMGHVSNMLHKDFEVGQSIDIAAPSGEFFLEESAAVQRPLVLLGGGIGITPIMSILQSALDAEPEREIILISANAHEHKQAFAKEFESLAQQHPNFKYHYRFCEPAPEGVTRSLGQHVSEGLVDIALIESLVGNPDADFYFCGPKPFMVSIYHSLLQWGTPKGQIHFEFFGPRQQIESAPEDAVA